MRLTVCLSIGLCPFFCFVGLTGLVGVHVRYVCLESSCFFLFLCEIPWPESSTFGFRDVMNVLLLSPDLTWVSLHSIVSHHLDT